MNETNVGATEGRYSHSHGGGWDFLHDDYRTREHATVSGLHRNDGTTGRIASPRIVDQGYRLKAAALSGGLCISGIVYTVIQFVGK